jgi:hypothetical protein
VNGWILNPYAVRGVFNILFPVPVFPKHTTTYVLPHAYDIRCCAEYYYRSAVDVTTGVVVTYSI